MKPLFITATNTGIGKTHTAIRLIHHFGAKGIRITPFKPIETGVRGVPEDAAKLLEAAKCYNSALQPMVPEDICPLRFSLPASPFVARGDRECAIEKIEERFEYLQSTCDLLLIEGAGGLMVPLECDFFMVDLISLFDANTLLVTHDRLGSINDTLLSLSLLKSRGLSYEWCVNIQNEAEFAKTTLPFYSACFGRILTLPALSEWAERLISN